jgi:D-beta-D-heptose 7-phosphate kinase/D-beta-D-heptose 1-phosphate adenosyltransferase
MRTHRTGRLLKDKIKSLAALKKIIAGLKRSGKRIVFTNGCFDLMHFGHAKYLEDAKRKGDILVVAVNSDSSVRKMKGRNRPVIAEKNRLRMMAALESVDFVLIFSEETPLRVIKALKPDILVKGADWDKNNIVGSDFVASYGGRVSTIKLVQGLSTTILIHKIADKFQD